MHCSAGLAGVCVAHTSLVLLNVCKTAFTEDSSRQDKLGLRIIDFILSNPDGVEGFTIPCATVVLSPPVAPNILVLQAGYLDP